VQWIADPAREAEGRANAERLAAAHPRTARIRTLVAAYDQRRALRLLADPSPTAQAAGRAQLEDVLRRSAEVADDVRVLPRERFRASALAAWVALDLDRPEIALARFAAARAFDPDDGALREGEGRARVALAQTEFQGARTTLDAGAADPAARAQAQARVEAALDLLQVVALDAALPRELRARARCGAGTIQAWLGRLPNAERHFRAALELARSAEACLGLAQVLVARAQVLPAAAERDALLREAVQTLEEHEALKPGSPDAAALRARIAALRA
jgi:hypothetical protein